MEIYAIEAKTTLRDSALRRLAAAGYEQCWQIVAMPREVLMFVLKPDEARQELTLVLHAVQQAYKSNSEGNGAGDIVTGLRTVAKNQSAQLRESRRLRKRSRGRSSSSFASDEGEFNATRKSWLPHPG